MVRYVGPQAPTDLAPRLSEMLGRWTGRRWIASVSSDPGKPTLTAQKATNADTLRSQAEADPMVQAILKTFPGAKLDAVRRKGDQTSLVAGLAAGVAVIDAEIGKAAFEHAIGERGVHRVAIRQSG